MGARPWFVCAIAALGACKPSAEEAAFQALKESPSTKSGLDFVSSYPQSTHLAEAGEIGSFSFAAAA
jgi:hypothetical protein